MSPRLEDAEEAIAPLGLVYGDPRWRVAVSAFLRGFPVWRIAKHFEMSQDLVERLRQR